jgi:hypothetical protein
MDIFLNVVEDGAAVLEENAIVPSATATEGTRPGAAGSVLNGGIPQSL